MKGILFKPDMIKAIVEGRKTVTRRLIKEFNVPLHPIAEVHQDGGGNWIGWYPGEKGLAEFTKLAYPKGEGVKSRYQVGEVVYIKEAWATEKRFNLLKPSEIRDSASIWYASDGVGEWPIGLDIGRLRSPMFLEKRFARYFIQITNVRAERLQEIPIKDAIAEGCPEGIPIPLHDKLQAPIVIHWYANTWDSINKEHPWASNPWVWRYEFQKAVREPTIFWSETDGSIPNYEKPVKAVRDAKSRNNR